MTTPWIAAAKQDPSFEPSELNTLEAYLDGSLDTPTTTQQLTLPSQAAAVAPNPRRIWTMLLTLIQEDAEVHDKITELIGSLYATPRPEIKGALDWSEWQEDFGHIWRDNHDSLWARHIAIRDVSDLAARQWINFHAFSAAAVHAGFLGNIFQVLVLIVDALEKPVGPEFTPQQEVDAVAAAQYFVKAGREIFRYPWDTDNSEGIKWDLESELWTGKEGFSLERWDFWKERLEALHAMEGFSDEAREAIWKAAVMIGKVKRLKWKGQ